MRSEQQTILAEFNATAHTGGSNGLANDLSELGASVQALGALRTYFDDLANVAPPQIENDAKIVAQSYDQEFNDASNVASNPLGSLAGALMQGLGSSSQTNAMNAFALKYCGRSV
jgi:hypothetical protein